MDGSQLVVTIMFLTTIQMSHVLSDTKVLMVMVKGDGSDVENLWGTQGGFNDVNESMSDWSVLDLISHGTFRSSDVDLWQYGSPSEVALQAVNGLGDVLWEVSFSTLGTQQMLTSWFQVSHMINSTSRDMIDGTDTEIYFGVDNTQLLFAMRSNSSLSWFYVDNSDVIRPRFYLTRNISSTQNRDPGPSSGFWDDLIFVSSITPVQAVMQVDLSPYSDSGDSYTFLIQQLVKIHIGLLVNYFLKYNLYHSMLSCSPNWGSPFTDSDGQTVNFTSRILMLYDIETTAARCLTVHVLETMATGVTVTFVGKTISVSFVEAQAMVITGYWPNGTFPTSITTTVSTTSTTSTTTPTSSSTTTPTSSSTTTPTSSSTTPTSSSTTTPTSSSTTTPTSSSTTPTSNSTTPTSGSTTPTSSSTTPTSSSTTPTSSSTTPTSNSTTPTSNSTTPTSSSTTPTSHSTTPISNSTTPTSSSTIPTSSSTTPTSGSTTPTSSSTTPTSSSTTPTSSSTTPTSGSTTPTSSSTTTTGTLTTTYVTTESTAFTTTTTQSMTTEDTTGQSVSTTDWSTTTTAGSSSGVSMHTTEMTTASEQCNCQCTVISANTSMTQAELAMKLAKLRKELAVNRSTLSSYIRKRRSMPDSRVSAQSIGFVGVGIITTIILFVFILDFQFFKQTAKTVNYRLTSRA